jgi:hypothetical protein
MVKGDVLLPEDTRITEWRIPIVKCPIQREDWENYLANAVTRYSPPKPATVLGDSKGWLQVKAYGPPKSSQVDMPFLGWLLIPSDYVEVWRSLNYGCIFTEAVLKHWDEETKDFAHKKYPRGEEITKLRCRNNAAVAAAQFVVYRRYVVEELITLPLDSRPKHPRILTEFALRDVGDWHSTSYEDAVKESNRAFKLDPVSSKNRAFFRKFNTSAQH